MEDANTITAHEPGPGGPPVNGSTSAKLFWARFHPPADPDVSFVGKTVLVTGANTGLGLEAAVKFAAKKAKKLLLGVRSVLKGEEAKEEIIKRTACAADSIEILQVDLSDFESVQRFVRKVEEATAGQPLDIVMLNAGMANPTYTESKHGWEIAVQVNVLSTALMAILLLPKLRSSMGTKPAHLSFVNSVGHADVDRKWFDESLLQATSNSENFEVTKSYIMVKLLGMAVMLNIAKAVSATDVIVNACCPSLCRTNLGRNWSLAVRIPMGAIQSVIARSAEQGGRCLVSSTVLGPESHGRLWHLDVLWP
jgi:NAD(P)-dependent dehydrogenase (short-subunit alcohol dehydrogenase family)